MKIHTLGAILRELRERKELTQAEVADRMGVSGGTISKFEARPSTVSLLLRYMDAIGVDFGDLARAAGMQAPIGFERVFPARRIPGVRPEMVHMLDTVKEIESRLQLLEERITPYLPQDDDSILKRELISRVMDRLGELPTDRLQELLETE